MSQIIFMQLMAPLVSSSRLENARATLVMRSQENDEGGEDDAYGEYYDGISVARVSIQKARNLLESKRNMSFRYNMSSSHELIALNLIGVVIHELGM